MGEIKDNLEWKHKNIILRCPKCGEEIISSRVNMENKIGMYREQYLNAIEGLKRFKELDKTQQLDANNFKDKMELETIKKESLNKLQEYKIKRSIIAEKENSSIYFALKKAIIEVCGNETYIKCMNRAMDMVGTDDDRTNFDIINIDE